MLREMAQAQEEMLCGCFIQQPMAKFDSDLIRLSSEYPQNTTLGHSFQRGIDERFYWPSLCSDFREIEQDSPFLLEKTEATFPQIIQPSKYYCNNNEKYKLPHHLITLYHQSTQNVFNKHHHSLKEQEIEVIFLKMCKGQNPEVIDA